MPLPTWSASNRLNIPVAPMVVGVAIDPARAEREHRLGSGEGLTAIRIRPMTGVISHA